MMMMIRVRNKSDSQRASACFQSSVTSGQLAFDMIASYGHFCLWEAFFADLHGVNGAGRIYVQHQNTTFSSSSTEQIVFEDFVLDEICRDFLKITKNGEMF